MATLMSLFTLNTVIFECSATFATIFCLALATAFVGSLYIRSDNSIRFRDDPNKVKERFFRVGAVCTLAVPLLALCSTTAHTVKSRTIFEWLGLRLNGCITATTLPLILTMILFLGPLYLHYIDGIMALYKDRNYWLSNIKNLIWLRNHIVGPLSEEFVFRACMLPILVPTFGETCSIFLCPVFFGVAHVHHMKEKLKDGIPLNVVILQTVVQFSYTTVFGMYSAFLFLRTGHFIAPLLAHSFCNHMGLPNLQEVTSLPPATRKYVIGVFVAGLVAWIVLLYPLTYPPLYSNTLYYST